MVRKLVLHAAELTHPPPDAGALADTLTRLGLTGPPLGGEEGVWLAGDAFLSLVIFLGCSPHVELRPADTDAGSDGAYCHVRYRVVDGAPVFRAAPGPLRPRCPACRKPVGEGRSWSSREVGAGAMRLDCPACGQVFPVAQLDWRQGAGMGRWFLELWNIHPHEAVPAEALITALEQVAGTPVRYFYE